MNFFLLINVKMPTIVGILTFISGKNSILGLSEPTKSQISRYFYTYEHLKLHEKSFITSGPGILFAGNLPVASDVFNGVFLCCPFSHKMFWMSDDIWDLMGSVSVGCLTYLYAF